MLDRGQRCAGWTRCRSVLMYGGLPAVPAAVGGRRRGRRRPPAGAEPARPRLHRLHRRRRVHRRRRRTPSRSGRTTSASPETGAVDAGQVVFAPGPVRVDARKVAVGGAASPGPAARRHRDDGVVTVDVEVVVPAAGQGRRARHRRAARTGSRSPGRSRRWAPSPTPARTSRATRPARRRSTSSSRSTPRPPPRRRARSTRHRSPSLFTAQERKGVLAVPVAALLALAEGGYGVAGRGLGRHDEDRRRRGRAVRRRAGRDQRRRDRRGHEGGGAAS